MRNSLRIICLLLGFIGLGQNLRDIRENFEEFKKAENYVGSRRILNGDTVKGYHKSLERSLKFWELRAGPDGILPSSNEIHRPNKDLSKNRQAERSPASTSWSNISETDPVDVIGLGRLNCIAFHPTDPDIIFVGAPAGGIWKRENGTWTALGNDLPVQGVSSIYIHPTQPDTMWIATGDGDAAGSLSAFGNILEGDTKSMGIFKTIDGGETWEQKISAELSDGILIRKLIGDKFTGSNQYAASSIGLLVTTDGWETFDIAASGYFMDVEWHPNDASVLYASTYLEGTVIRSTDYGVTWTAVAEFNPGVCARIDIELSANGGANAVDFIAVNYQGGLLGMYFSNDRGDNWAQYVDGDTENLLGYYEVSQDNSGQGMYDLAFEIDPTDYSKFYVGGINVWKSTDEGLNWGISSIWTLNSEYNATATQEVHADHHALEINPLDGKLYDANDGGIYVSSDNGTTWENISHGLEIHAVYSIEESFDDAYIAGLQDNGTIIVSQLTGSAIVSRGDGMNVEDAHSDSVIYPSYVNGVIYRTDIRGILPNATISENLPGGQLEGEWLTPFIVNPLLDNTIYAAYDEVYQSNDYGDTWFAISNFGFGVTINYLEQSQSNYSKMYGAYLDQYFYTHNGGFNWSTGSGLPTSEYISCVKSFPLDEDIVFVGYSGYSANEKLFVSYDGGATFEDFGSDLLPNAPVNCLEFDDKNGDLYIGTDVGTYRYDGVAYEYVGAGMPICVVTDLEYDSENDRMLAGTFGRGVWEFPTVGILASNNEVEEDVLGISLFPNPVSNLLTVQLDERCDGRYAIKDQIGRQVLTRTFNGSAITCDVSTLSPGTYYVEVFIDTKRTVKRFKVSE